MLDIFLQLGLVIGLAVTVAFIMHRLGQPQVVGYILAGLMISTVLSQTVAFNDIESFAHIGVALLLFMVGLSLNPQLVREMGTAALWTGIGQIVFTSVLGYGLGLAMGFTPIQALYLAVAFTFSSTVIIMRLLHERGDEESLYGRLAIGFLIVQDLVAMVILIAVSMSGRWADGAVDWGSSLSLLVMNVAAIGLVAYVLAVYVIPRVDRIFARNSEILVLFALAICFGAAGVFQYLGFSMEMGALIAGLVLASSPYQREMAARVKPLRDFFLVLFFVALGFQLNPVGAADNWLPILVYSLFILVGNPLVVWILMGWMNYSRRTSFFAGLTVAQISEFSLILLALGVAMGHIGPELMTVGVVVGLVTITASSYAIVFGDGLYQRMKTNLWWFKEGRAVKQERKRQVYEVIIFGAHRLGGGLIEKLKRTRERFLVVDHDPLLVEALERKRIPVVFGDVSEPEFLESLPWRQAKLIVSSVPDLEVNLSVLSSLRKRRARVTLIAVAANHEEARRLYAAGADYVVVPPYLGRKYIAELVSRYKFNKVKYHQERARHWHELMMVAER